MRRNDTCLHESQHYSLNHSSRYFPGMGKRKMLNILNLWKKMRLEKFNVYIAKTIESILDHLPLALSNAYGQILQRKGSRVLFSEKATWNTYPIRKWSVQDAVKTHSHKFWLKNKTKKKPHTFKVKEYNSLGKKHLFKSNLHCKPIMAKYITWKQDRISLGTNRSWLNSI